MKAVVAILVLLFVLIVAIPVIVGGLNPDPGRIKRWQDWLTDQQSQARDEIAT